ncbi:bacterioferritin-associated ferredoxin [Dongia sp.]|uniref:(2Fe-2S)-binding protein n=1 Tax=Dongia sp. TaxID=1977262 RepID=UPI0035B18C71
MYVCICNGYRDSEIARTAQASGLTCPRKVYELLGSGPCCGTCLPTAQEIIDGTHEKRAAAPLPLAAE